MPEFASEPKEPAIVLQLPAVLDESKAPHTAVVSRFCGGQMLRGKIEQVADEWTWHFVLDRATNHDRSSGAALSYEQARGDLTAALARFDVPLARRRLSPALPPRTPGGRAIGELPLLR